MNFESQHGTVRGYSKVETKERKKFPWGPTAMAVLAAAMAYGAVQLKTLNAKDNDLAKENQNLQAQTQAFTTAMRNYDGWKAEQDEKTDILIDTSRTIIDSHESLKSTVADQQEQIYEVKDVNERQDQDLDALTDRVAEIEVQVGEVELTLADLVDTVDGGLALNQEALANLATQYDNNFVKLADDLNQALNSMQNGRILTGVVEVGAGVVNFTADDIAGALGVATNTVEKTANTAVGVVGDAADSVVNVADKGVGVVGTTTGKVLKLPWTLVKGVYNGLTK